MKTHQNLTIASEVMVLNFLKYLEFLDESFRENKQHIEDAKFEIKLY